MTVAEVIKALVDHATLKNPEILNTEIDMIKILPDYKHSECIQIEFTNSANDLIINKNGVLYQWQILIQQIWDIVYVS